MIRPVVARDLDRVMVLLRQLWPGKELGSERLSSVLETYVRDACYFIRGYERDGTLVGLVTVSFRSALFYEGRVAIIEDLIVDEVHRGQGIGEQLVRCAEDRIREEGIGVIELSSDLDRKETHKFWQECGYSKLAYQFRKQL